MAKKISHIFIDMDGVLCDFVEASIRLHQRSPPWAYANWPEGEYEIYNVLGIAEDEFWEPIHGAGWEWWAAMPAFEWAATLVELCEQYADTVAIATSPSRDGSSSFGKMRWMQQYFPRLTRKMMIGPRKEWLAAPGRVLIDDSDEKATAFAKAGGTPILFPQLWNRNRKLLDAECRLEYVARRLEAQ